MVSIICSPDAESLRKVDSKFRVLLYGSATQSPDGFSIGNTCKDEIRHLDLLPDQRAFDFLTIGLSVVAADTFILRDEYGSDGFSRRIELTIALGHPAPWNELKFKLQNTLNFLTGDNWIISFIEGGETAPAKYEHKHIRSFNRIHKADSACLFSGGLDSFIGAVLQKKNRTPVLVSRSSTGDQQFQNAMASCLPDLPRFVVNDSPQSPPDLINEISTRARSFLFLAMGAIVCSSLSRFKGGSIPLIVPENGFIALNPPLTKQRIGANSTRTAHPYYLEAIQSIFDSIGIPASIENPFALETKGEMLINTKSNPLIIKHAIETVSCGHWKRRNMQCGRCWPCLIRRSSFFKAKMSDTTKYQTPSLKKIINNSVNNKDLKAVLYALHQFDKNGRKSAPVMSIRHLSRDLTLRENYLSLIERGFEELREFLFDQEVWS